MYTPVDRAKLEAESRRKFAEQRIIDAWNLDGNFTLLLTKDYYPIGCVASADLVNKTYVRIDYLSMLTGEYRDVEVDGVTAREAVMKPYDEEKGMPEIHGKFEYMVCSKDDVSPEYYAIISQMDGFKDKDTDTEFVATALAACGKHDYKCYHEALGVPCDGCGWEPVAGALDVRNADA